MRINIARNQENIIINKLKDRDDADAMRMVRFFAMPDLTRIKGHVMKEIVDRIIKIQEFKSFDIIDVPEIMSSKIAFDLFDFPADHPARSKSDTYYPNEEMIMRTQTTVMWYYYFKQESIKKRLERKEPLGVFCFGKVYRKDEIDRHHMNVFHQIDALYIAPKKTEPINLETLKKVELDIVQAIFGKVKYRFVKETFPYTHPSTEIEIKRDNDWLEILGSGVVKPSVLKKLGVDPSVYNGWAFGSGIERWAMISNRLPDIRFLWSNDERIKKQLVLGREYCEVSKYPPVIRDISFIVNKRFQPNIYFDMVRDIANDIVEEVLLIDEYENDEKFGIDKKSYAYRITYRSIEKTLTSDVINALHKEIEKQTLEQFSGEVR